MPRKYYKRKRYRRRRYRRKKPAKYVRRYVQRAIAKRMETKAHNVVNTKNLAGTGTAPQWYVHTLGEIPQGTSGSTRIGYDVQCVKLHLRGWIRPPDDLRKYEADNFNITNNTSATATQNTTALNLRNHSYMPGCMMRFIVFYSTIESADVTGELPVSVTAPIGENTIMSYLNWEHIHVLADKTITFKHGQYLRTIRGAWNLKKMKLTFEDGSNTVDKGTNQLYFAAVSGDLTANAGEYPAIHYNFMLTYKDA